ncbi:MAG: phage tail protein [Paracoccus sp. (in: a-proteobacteria)]|nr:phage tail protein [Paracoccus sp. (in: a-proteobacteria)]
MADLPETVEYPAGIYQIEQADPVLGGAPNEATGAGLVNIGPQQLAKRTRWLKTRVDQLLSKVVAASTSVAGIVRLSSAVTSTSETLAATPRAVKTVNDKAEAAALKATQVTGTGLASGGGTLAANREINVPAATKAEAEAGTDNARAMTPLRVAQAIATRLGALRIAAGDGLSGGGSLSADRTFAVDDSVARSARQIIAGDGLSGGGTLAANRVFAVDDTVVRAPRRVEAGGMLTGGGSLEMDRSIHLAEATLAAAQEGTSPSGGMSPRRVRAAIEHLAASSLAVNGWQRLPNGLIIQWVYRDTYDEEAVSITLPIAFPNAALGAWVTHRGTAARYYGAAFISKSQMDVYARSNVGPSTATNRFNALVIGY